jgi:hypothetical protein
LNPAASLLNQLIKFLYINKLRYIFSISTKGKTDLNCINYNYSAFIQPKKETMKTILISTLSLFLSYLTTNLNGQANLKWGKQFGTTVEEGSLCITTDLAGNVYNAGYTCGVLGDQNFGIADAFITKLDSAGTILWACQFGTAENEFINAITTDSLCNVYVAGFTMGIIDVAKFGAEDVFVAKIDSSGVIVWKKQFGTDKKDVGNGIFIDDSGNVYVAGETAGFFGDSVCGGFDSYVLKLDNDGNKKYLRQFGTIKDESCSRIALDSTGNIYISGSTFGNLGDINKGQDDAYIAIFDNEMNPIRYIQFGTSANDGYMKLALDKEENIYVGGSTGGNLGANQEGNGDAFLAKINKLGEILWINQFGMAGWDGIHGIVIDELKSGNVIVSGCQNWPVCQSFVREYRKDGKLIGVQNFAMIQSGKGTCGQNLCLDNTGNIYHTGITDESLYCTVIGQHDLFVLKLEFPLSSTKPYVNNLIANQTATAQAEFNFVFSDTTFISGITNPNFTYSAFSANGTSLPSWLTFEPGTRTFSGVPATAGSYYIKLIASDDSNSVASCMFKIKVSPEVVSIENTTSPKVLFFPNPTSDRLEIKLDNALYKEAEVKITNIEGRNTYTNIYRNTKSISIDLQGNPKGIYFVKLYLDEEMYTKIVCLE